MEHVEIGVPGMAVDVNQHAGNGVRLAMNVVYPAPGVAQPRPGFRKVDSTLGAERVVKLLRAGDIVDVVENPDVEGQGYDLFSESGNGYDTNDSAEVFFATDAHVFSVESRSNQYYSIYAGASRTASGIRGRVHGATSLVRAGYPGFLPPPYFSQTAGTATAILTGKHVSYRYTLENTLGDVLRVSIPSPRKLIGGYGFDTDMQVQCNLPSSAAVGDTLRLYRTTNADTLDVSDQHFLQGSRELTSSDISAGYYTFTDSTADADLRDALYTNPERGGILASNYRPPACKTIEAFQGSVLFGNTAQPHRLKVRFTTLYNDRTGQATGIGFRDTTGTITGGGAATVTGATTTGLKIGMVLSDVSGWTGSGPVRITNIVGGTLTLSHVYAGASGSFAGKFWFDSIRVSCADGSGEDRYFPSMLALVPTRNIFEYYFLITDATTATTRMTAAGVYSLGDMTVNADGLSVTGEMMIEKYQPGGAALEVWATHGSEYDPPLPEPTVGSGEASTADVWEDAVYWSKRYEPEHVPLLNYARVGRLGSPILRMLAGQDCVWIFKADGVYRLSGFGERSGFRVDPIYPELVLRTPGCADQMGGTVYAYTNLGLVSFAGPGGYQFLDTPISGYLRACADYMGTANETEASCTFVACNPNSHEVLLGPTDEDNGDESAHHVYVYNVRAQAWSRWGGDDEEPYDGFGLFTDNVSCAIAHPVTGRMWFGDALRSLSGEVAIWCERREPDDDVQFADFMINMPVQTTADGTTFTYTAFDAWSDPYTVRVGDLIIDDDDNRFVVIDTSAGTFTINGVATTPIVPYASFASAVQWNARGAGAPGVRKQWSRGSVLFGQLSGVYQWQWLTRSSENVDDDSTTMRETYAWADSWVRDIVTPTRVPSNPRSVFAHRQNARCELLYPEIVICQGDARWQLTGLELTYKPLAQRLAKRVYA